MHDSKPPTYVFANTPQERELRRLRQLEAIFDPSSRRALEQTSLGSKSLCLEVGAGAGSIAQWLAEQVGPTGRVHALDLDPRFLSLANRPNLEVIEADIRDWNRRSEYDLVHARYVIVHLSEFERALSKMVASLRPSGWLVLEEPDFVAARFVAGPPEIAVPFERVNAAIVQMFRNRRMDPALGVRLPSLVQTMGLTVVTVENETHLVAGGSEVALTMKASTEQLRDAYVATGLAAPEDVEGYLRFAQEPATWAIYYATVRVVARRA